MCGRDQALLFALGTVVTNSSSTDAPSVMIYYTEYASNPVIYPNLDRVLTVASHEMSEVSIIIISYIHVCTFSKILKTLSKSLYYNISLLYTMYMVELIVFG